MEVPAGCWGMGESYVNQVGHLVGAQPLVSILRSETFGPLVNIGDRSCRFEKIISCTVQASIPIGSMCGILT